MNNLSKLQQDICLEHFYSDKQINSTDRCNNTSCVNRPEHNIPQYDQMKCYRDLRDDLFSYSKI